MRHPRISSSPQEYPGHVAARTSPDLLNAWFHMGGSPAMLNDRHETIGHVAAGVIASHPESFMLWMDACRNTGILQTMMNAWADDGPGDSIGWRLMIGRDDDGHASPAHIDGLKQWMDAGGDCEQVTPARHPLWACAMVQSDAVASSFFHSCQMSSRWQHLLHARTSLGQTMGHLIKSDDLLDAWIRAGGDVHARDDRGRPLCHVGKSDAFVYRWVSWGGNICDAIPNPHDRPWSVFKRDRYAHVKEPSTIAITRIWGHIDTGLHDRIGSHAMLTAIQDPMAHDLALRLGPYIRDPIQMARWMQAVSDTVHQ
jgi:hypothetical protein